jgi:hypothetical protein
MQQTVIGDEYFPGMDVQTDEQILEVYVITFAIGREKLIS